MGAFDATGFLVSLISVSASVSLLLGGLALLKEKLLTHYRARTLYQLRLLLTVLLLFPWRPALLLPKITLPAIPVVEPAAFTEDASLASTRPAHASIQADDPAAPGTAFKVSTDDAAKGTSGDTKQQAALLQGAAPLTHQETGIPWAQVLFAVWLAGAVSVLLFQTIRHARFLRLVRRWRSPVPQEVQATLAEQCAHLRITPPPAYIAPCVQSPTVVGLLRPMLLLPEIAYDPQQLNLMLTHELIHLKHGHLWGKALSLVTLAVHWFNPLMIFLLREMGAICEMACDEAVLTLNGPEHRSDYVDAILNAALLSRTVRTPLCSPLNGGVKQMNQIKQRITLLTPFRPRRIGAGLIVLTLLLALLTGSVLADTAAASTFVIPESDWLEPASDYMPQADYDLLMSMQTPGWEELFTEEYAEQIAPQLPKLKAIFDYRWPVNRFMRHLQYSVTEAESPHGVSYKVRWSTGFGWDELPGSVLLTCELNWRYLGDKNLTCGQRNQLLDEALHSADRAMRALNIAETQKTDSMTDASNELGAQLNEMAKELGGNALSIWFSSVDFQVFPMDESQAKKERREILAPLTPEGYRDQTVADYQVLLEKYQGMPSVQEAIESIANKTVFEAYEELRGYPTYLSGVTVDPSLMPAWTTRGRISYMYRLDWKTVDRSSITVGQRHDAIVRLMTHIIDAAANAVWEANDWEAFLQALKERLPKMAQEESTPALTFTVSDVKLDLRALATKEYVHSSPQRALNAFMTACYDQDTAQMKEVLEPIGTDDKSAEMLAAREEKLKFLVEMHPGYWELGEARKESGKDDVVIINLKFYKFGPDDTSLPGVVNRLAQLKQIDGKWYLLLESLQL